MVWPVSLPDKVEFARCTTAGGFNRVLVHAAPEKAKIEIIAADDQVVARGDLDRHGEYSPMTLVELDGSTLHRSEVWPTEEFYGLPVLLSGGEVGLLQKWHHAESAARPLAGSVRRWRARHACAADERLLGGW